MKDRFDTTWLAKKAKIYDELTKAETPTIKTVDFRLSDTYSGWVKMIVLVDDKPISTVFFSYVFGPDPIVGLLIWAENIIESMQIPQFMVYSGEGTDYLFYFENINYGIVWDNSGPTTGVSVFSLEVLPGLGEKKLICAFCDTKTLIGNLYKAV